MCEHCELLKKYQAAERRRDYQQICSHPYESVRNGVCSRCGKNFLASSTKKSESQKSCVHPYKDVESGFCTKCRSRVALSWGGH
jgi:rRNA maturation endonuclease Nob1